MPTVSFASCIEIIEPASVHSSFHIHPPDHPPDETPWPEPDDTELGALHRIFQHRAPDLPGPRLDGTFYKRLQRSFAGRRRVRAIQPPDFDRPAGERLAGGPYPPASRAARLSLFPLVGLAWDGRTAGNHPPTPTKHVLADVPLHPALGPLPEPFRHRPAQPVRIHARSEPRVRASLLHRDWDGRAWSLAMYAQDVPLTPAEHRRGADERWRAEQQQLARKAARLLPGPCHALPSSAEEPPPPPSGSTGPAPPVGTAPRAVLSTAPPAAAFNECWLAGKVRATALARARHAAAADDALAAGAYMALAQLAVLALYHGSTLVLGPAAPTTAPVVGATVAVAGDRAVVRSFSGPDVLLVACVLLAPCAHARLRGFVVGSRPNDDHPHCDDQCAAARRLREGRAALGWRPAMGARWVECVDWARADALLDAACRKAIVRDWAARVARLGFVVVATWMLIGAGLFVLAGVEALVH